MSLNQPRKMFMEAHVTNGFPVSEIVPLDAVTSVTWGAYDNCAMMLLTSVRHR
jgi:hypothetical protein